MKNLKPGMLTYEHDEAPVISNPTRVFIMRPMDMKPIAVGSVCPDSINVEEIEAPKKDEAPGRFSVEMEHHFSVKDLKRFRKTFFKKSRLPRKLKKAYRHMALTNDSPKIDRTAFKDGSIKLTCDMGPESYIRIKPGYHRTKWINKAICHFKKAHQAWWNYYKKKFENAINNSNREYVVTKEEQKRLADIINRK